VNVNLVTDEAEAVLAILTKKRANQALTNTDWQRLFDSEGYTRLKKREASMQRSFTDEEFKSFVLSDKLSAARSRSQKRSRGGNRPVSRERRRGLWPTSRKTLTSALRSIP
jgi:hypothetical protein